MPIPSPAHVTMSIRILPEQLASQIAAGEVVERPASVVKELLENSIDAGASAIQVEIREGGRELIQVADDGCGIAPEEAELAFMRHATSKLESADALSHITTLGFRGEALAAIASVSQVTLVTRTTEATAGLRLVLEGGQTRRRDMVGAAVGTVIAVEKLFFNTPARLKFLKAVSTERRVIDEFITCYALAYPHIRFRLSHNGRVTFQSSGQGRLQDVLIEVYGLETAREMLPISNADSAEATEGPPVRVTGYVAPPNQHRANRNQITLFINGRWVRDGHLTFAVMQAYHTLLPTGRYPVALIFINLPPEEVDVNVHPTKSEVRFRHPNQLFGEVQRTVRHALLAATPIRSLGSLTPTSPPGWAGALGPAAFQRSLDPEATPEAFDLDWPMPDVLLTGRPADSEEIANRPAPAATALGGTHLPIMRVVGQVGAAYIITEGPDGLFLIDQHAAHERILYEQFMAAYAAHSLPSQGLVAGQVVHLTPTQAALLEEQLELLNQLGFHLEAFGPQTFMLRALPAMLVNQDPTQAVIHVLDELEAGGRPLAGELEARLIRRVCKTAAIKAGQTLSLAEMEALVRQLEKCHNPHTCPHGRPTLIHLSVAQLAREFGRL